MEKKVDLRLRLPADLHARLVESARGNSPVNSLNHEIIQRLEASFTADTAVGEMVARTEALLREVRSSRGRLESELLRMWEFMERAIDDEQTTPERRRKILQTLQSSDIEQALKFDLGED